MQGYDDARVLESMQMPQPGERLNRETITK